MIAGTSSRASAPDRRPRVLAIAASPALTEWLTMVLSGGGYDVRTALIAGRGEELFADWCPDVVLTDLVLPDRDGIDLLLRLKAIDPHVDVLVMAEPGSTQRAVEAGRAGAFDFLEKPLVQEPLLELLRKAVPRSERHESTREARVSPDENLVIGRSAKMQELFELVGHVAGSDANILILGENGTGKEVVANAIHLRSPRARNPFVKINCAAIPRDLIESELCGYRKGAFTGATADKVGLLEVADGGSLLLDEIGEMPAYLQTKLLRILQEREFRPIGSDRVVKVDFRLICATNVAVEAALREGRLREDLYFRINTITLTVPPLRERVDELPMLVAFFLARFNQRHGRAVRGLSAQALALLRRASWPGNVRELENVIERAVLVCRTDEIGSEDLPDGLKDAVKSDAFAIPPHRTLAEIERMAILQTLERTNWNKQEAAQVLGLYRPTLYSKMRKHRITDDRGVRGKSSAGPR